MRSNRIRRQVRSVQQPVSSTAPAKPVKKTVEKPVSDRKERRGMHKMEEEKREPEPVEEYSDENSEEITSDSEADMEVEMEPKEVKERMADEVSEKIKPTMENYKAIRERYAQLTRELWESQEKLEQIMEDFGFSEEERELLNKRSNAWLEYFIANATFRDENVNLFEYMDTFMKTQKFL